jgi:hypothetical protein
MESFGGSVKLMLFVYAVAAVISLITAWIIKLIFVAIQFRKNGATSKHNKSKTADAHGQKAS